MCPFRYLYHILIFLLSNILLTSCVDWRATFNPEAVIVKTSSKQRVHVVLSGLSDEAIANIANRDYLQLRTEDEDRATVTNDGIKFFELSRENRSWDANFDLNGIFLGKY